MPQLVCFGGLVLFVADLFHPVNRFAVELFLNGDVRHGRGRRSTMPILVNGTPAWGRTIAGMAFVPLRMKRRSPPDKRGGESER